MNDMEQYERACLREEEAQRVADDLVTPDVMQIMDHHGKDAFGHRGAIYSVDCNRATTTGVQIVKHPVGGYTVLVTAKFPEFIDTGDEERVAHLSCIHRIIGNAEGLPFYSARKFAASLMRSNDYLNKDNWRFNV